MQQGYIPIKINISFAGRREEWGSLSETGIQYIGLSYSHSAGALHYHHHIYPIYSFSLPFRQGYSNIPIHLLSCTELRKYESGSKYC
jgi:hypothetical protein